ncbi:MAG: pyruvate:ferredoxin (flavodoxin) oxidoreductase [Peptostreptococcales bacterium]
MAKIMKTMDGNAAASYVSYAFTDVAAIYPITPSSTMAENVDEWAAYGKKNLFGQEVRVAELQSEGGAAGAVHGSLSAGALTTTFTASQGLLLMIPNMYKISGELLPGVFHVSARALSTHALSIFGDHSDVMAARQTGFALLASGSVQEVMDLGGVAHLAAIKGRIPFVHFFDGFRTSHEIQKIEVIDYHDFDKLLDKEALKAFRDSALNPARPMTKGTAQNPDIYFQSREAANKYYDAIPGIVVDYMNEINKITGRDYKPFNYVGHPEAENIIVAMGSVTECIEETIDYLLAQGEKVGLIKVRLYRPFVPEYFMNVFPKSVKKIAVLDRTKEPGSIGEPLYQDIRTMFFEEKNPPIIVGGRYGLGSKDTTPTQILAVYENLKCDTPKNRFTIGINDDVTYTSLTASKEIITEPEGTIRCKFWGLGSDGTVGANKTAITIIGDKTNMYAQGYFSYDSKKSGGVTVSHLRFGKNPIKSTYLIDESDFIACHNQSYVGQYDLLKGLKKGGTFVLNSGWDIEELEENLPASMKKQLAQKQIKFYTIDATKLGVEIGLGNRINMIMQAAFFKLAKVIDIDDAVKYLKEGIDESYGKKGEEILKMNYAAVDKGISSLVEIQIPETWANATDAGKVEKEVPEFIKNVLIPMNKLQGDSLPVSTFAKSPDGVFPPGTAAYEKRGIAVDVPEWQPENCTQCNFCSFICPHASIRPVLVTEEEKANAPEGFDTVKPVGKGFDGYSYRIQVSPYDCTGCGNCADICPSKKKALVMKPLDSQLKQSDNWDYSVKLPIRDNLVAKTTVKGSQFAQPYLEFSGACAGCGETPYIKNVTQLFGDRMIISNATGCSSIWGSSAPSMPYTKDANGRGPAWASSLFEDNAEYGYGMALACAQMENKVTDIMTELLEMDINQEAKEAFVEWIGSKKDGNESKIASQKVMDVLPKIDRSNDKIASLVQELEDKKDVLIKKSIWILGGDGWAYDIGYGGLDHVLASGENVNVLVFDTEVYSNTGGQASKATPTAAVAKFAASGMKVKKKDLGLIAMSYGYIYVAQVGMGADKNQFMKAIQEAEAYDGPSLIIAYAPCINHGLKKGMGKTQENIKEAVDCGYWHLYRYNPSLANENKNPFILDSKEPKGCFRDFIMDQVRYSSLLLEFPDIAENLFEKAETEAKEKYETYKKMAQ